MRNYRVLDTALEGKLKFSQDTTYITGVIFYKISIGYHTKIETDYFKALDTFNGVKNLLTNEVI